MKKKLLTLFLVLASVAIFAQDQKPKFTVDGKEASPTAIFNDKTAASDFTATFTDGTTFNLYTFLNGGTNHYVMMDLFFTD